MVFTREKNDTSNQNRERCFFTCEKNDTSNQKPQRCASFAPKFPPFIAACSAASHTFINEKSFTQGVFLAKKVKNISEMEWNSFVCFTVDKENCGEPAKQQRKGKNRTRRKLMLCFFLDEYSVQLTGFPRMKNIQYLEAMKHKKGWSKKKKQVNATYMYTNSPISGGLLTICEH